MATSSASLDRSPKHNWVEDAGGLPPYVRKLARAISKSGHSLSSSIAIAISRVKAWAAGGGDVDADTRAKAVAALAQWEAAKARNKGNVKLSNDEMFFVWDEDETDLTDDEALALSKIPNSTSAIESMVLLSRKLKD